MGLAPLADMATLDLDTLMMSLDDRFVPSPLNDELAGLNRFDGSELDEAMRIALGDPPLVLLTVRSSGMVEVTEYGIRDELPGGYWLRPIDHGHRIPGLQDVSDPVDRSIMLATLLGDVTRRRAARFQKCEQCGLRTPPEDWYGDGHCLSCLEQMGLIIVR